MAQGYPSDPDARKDVSEAAALAALALTVFIVAARPTSPAASLYPAVGIALLSLSMIASRRDRRLDSRVSWVTVGILLLVVITFVGLADPRITRAAGSPSLVVLWYGGVVLWLVFGAALLLIGDRSSAGAIGSVAIVALTLVLAQQLIVRTSDQHIDVYWLHITAAEHLADGETPYAGLGVPDGSPVAQSGQVIDGYPYPPVTMLFYSLGSWAGDPRLTSLASWLLLLGTLARTTVRERRVRKRFALLLVVAAQPGWLFILQNSWTEPLTAAFLIGALVTWKPRPVVSSILLGLAVASKQYMALAIPLLLFGRADRRGTRLAIAAAAAGATILPFLSAELWNSTVDFFIDIPPRLDSSNLVGLLGVFGVEWDPGIVFSLGVPIVGTVILGRVYDDGTPERFAMALAMAIALAFFLGSQAFGNYWFIVGTTVASGLALKLNRDREPSVLPQDPGP